MEIITYRKRAVELVEKATGNGRVSPADEIYREVDSNRKARERGLSLNQVGIEQGWYHSSCAFLPHWMLENLFPLWTETALLHWLGREPEQPLSRLMGTTPRGAPAIIYEGKELQGGDVVGIWNRLDGTDAHVLVVIHENRENGELLTAEYGQPYGKRRTRYLFNGKIGRREVKRVLPLVNVVQQYEDTFPGVVE